MSMGLEPKWTSISDMLATRTDDQLLRWKEVAENPRIDNYRTITTLRQLVVDLYNKSIKDIVNELSIAVDNELNFRNGNINIDEKLEARIARLEKMLSNKSVKNEADNADAGAQAEFDKVVLDRMANEDFMDYMESNHEDGGMAFGDIRFAAEQLIQSDLPEAKALANDLARMADRVEKLYTKVKAKAEELRNKEEELRVNNGWTKTAVKARIRSLK